MHKEPARSCLCNSCSRFIKGSWWNFTSSISCCFRKWSDSKLCMRKSCRISSLTPLANCLITSINHCVNSKGQDGKLLRMIPTIKESYSNHIHPSIHPSICYPFNLAWLRVLLKCSWSHASLSGLRHWSGDWSCSSSSWPRVDVGPKLFQWWNVSMQTNDIISYV